MWLLRLLDNRVVHRETMAHSTEPMQILPITMDALNRLLSKPSTPRNKTWAQKHHIHFQKHIFLVRTSTKRRHFHAITRSPSLKSVTLYSFMYSQSCEPIKPASPSTNAECLSLLLYLYYCLSCSLIARVGYHRKTYYWSS